jgi:hypothetical protein
MQKAFPTACQVIAGVREAPAPARLLLHLHSSKQLQGFQLFLNKVLLVVGIQIVGSHGSERLFAKMAALSTRTRSPE